VGTMLSFMIPTDEKGFNLSTVPQQDETTAGFHQVTTNGHAEVKVELSGDLASLPVAQSSPNNNSAPAMTSTPVMPPALDNTPPLGPPLAPPLGRDLSLLDDSCSDDTVTDSTQLLRADDRSDEVMTPSTDNTRGSPCGEDKPLLPLQTTPVSVTGKTGKLKRVSFGSSKGSMVETVVYDYEPAQTLREEGNESPDPRATSRPSFATSTPIAPTTRAEPSAAEKAASRVRVTYFESKKPLTVPAPDPAEVIAPEDLDVAVPTPPGHIQVTAEAGEMPTTYIVQAIDAGWENPFRPGGELSKEADQIVRAIQSGRPLDSSLDETDEPEVATNGHSAAPAHNGAPVSEAVVSASVQTSVAAAPPAKPGAAGAPAATHRNGSSSTTAAPPAQTAVAAQQPGAVQVQHSLIKPEDASQVEQVTLKKKPRGKCCVVQ